MISRGHLRAPTWLFLIALGASGCVLGPSPDLPGGVPNPGDEALGNGSGGGPTSAGTGGTGGTSATGGSGGCEAACTTDCSGSGGSTGGAETCPGVGGTGGALAP